MSGTYSFLAVKAALVGPGVAVSLGDGAGSADEGISFESTQEINTLTTGAGGEAMHSLHADKSGRAMVRLLKTSPMNALLQAAFNIQTSNPLYHGRNTLSLADGSTGDVINCSQVAFARGVPLTYAKDGNINVWEFHCGRIDRYLGSLASLPTPPLATL